MNFVVREHLRSLYGRASKPGASAAARLAMRDAESHAARFEEIAFALELADAKAAEHFARGLNARLRHRFADSV